MKPITHHPARRFALAAGLAGAWLAVSAATGDIAPYSSAATAPERVAADRIFLAQAKPAPTEKPVSYTDEQADRGKKRYDAECEDCHGADLKGGLNGGAPLKGLAFEAKFADGVPASVLYYYMRTLMPPNDPGRYSESTYADLMAYILMRNGFDPGAPLPSEEDALDALVMVK